MDTARDVSSLLHPGDWVAYILYRLEGCLFSRPLVSLLLAPFLIQLAGQTVPVPHPSIQPMPRAIDLHAHHGISEKVAPCKGHSEDLLPRWFVEGGVLEESMR